jgi:hypothetical protein
MYGCVSEWGRIGEIGNRPVLNKIHVFIQLSQSVSKSWKHVVL